MGKYSSVTPGLPKLPDELRFTDKGSDFLEKVARARTKVNASGPGGLAARYRQLRDRQDRVAAIASRVFVELTAVEQMMWATLEDQKLSSVKLDDGAAVDVSEEPCASVKDHAALLEWLKASPLAAKLQLAWQTLNSEVKNRVLEGLPIPPGVEVYTRKQTRLRRNREATFGRRPF